MLRAELLTERQSQQGMICPMMLRGMDILPEHPSQPLTVQCGCGLRVTMVNARTDGALFWRRPLVCHATESTLESTFQCTMNQRTKPNQDRHAASLAVWKMTRRYASDRFDSTVCRVNKSFL
jgi:hypothetical protein